MKIWKWCAFNPRNKCLCSFVLVGILFLLTGGILQLIPNEPTADTTQSITENTTLTPVPPTNNTTAKVVPIKAMVSNRTADYNGGGELITPQAVTPVPEPRVEPAPEPEPKKPEEKPEEKPAITVIPMNPFNGSNAHEKPDKPTGPEKPKPPEIKPMPVPTGSPKPYVVQEVPTQHTEIDVSPQWNNPNWGNISPAWSNPGWQEKANVKPTDINRFNSTLETALQNGKIGKVANHIPIPQVRTDTNETQPSKRVGMDSHMTKDNLSRGPQLSVSLGRA